MELGYQYRNYDSSDTTSIPREPAILDIAHIGWAAPEGKIFVEWNTARDGTGTTYHNDDTWSPTISVYAIWAVDENYVTTASEITSIADAIRAKGATSALLLYPNGFVSAINAIETGIDISDTTAVTGDVLSGKYFYTASGTKTQGTIATKTASNLSASGKTVTVPAGYYASQYTKDVATGSATTPATTVSITPSISLNGTTGVISVSVSGTQSVTPTVSAGYVSSGTAGTITVNGSNTQTIPVWSGGSYGVKTITFNINLPNYKATQGMTWAQWVESKYNTNYFTIMNGTVCTSGGLAVQYSQQSVAPSDEIVENRSYTLQSGGPSQDL